MEQLVDECAIMLWACVLSVLRWRHNGLHSLNIAYRMICLCWLQLWASVIGVGCVLELSVLSGFQLGPILHLYSYHDKYKARSKQKLRNERNA